MSEAGGSGVVSGFLATLVRSVPVRVIDLSRGGCRLESSRRLEVGVTGRLHVVLEGQTHNDDVRVARCQPREGAGQSYVVGAELLATRRLNAQSVRLAVERLISATAVEREPVVGTDRSSHGTSEVHARQPGEPDGRPPPPTAGTET